jgi:hypothetical protein
MQAMKSPALPGTYSGSSDMPKFRVTFDQRTMWYAEKIICAESEPAARVLAEEIHDGDLDFDYEGSSTYDSQILEIRPYVENDDGCMVLDSTQRIVITRIADVKFKSDGAVLGVAVTGPIDACYLMMSREIASALATQITEALTT